MGQNNNPTKIGDDHLYPVLNPETSSAEFQNLKGKTLEVYYHLVRNPNAKFGVREVQRIFDYSSSSIAAYHLDRLVEYKLIEKTANGQYFVNKDPILLGELEDHVRIAGRLVPKIALYSYQAFLTILVAILLFLIGADLLIWFIYLIFSNFIFIIIILRDASKITSKLQVQ